MIGNTLDLIPLSKFTEYSKYPTVGALRQLIFYNTKGFKDKVVKIIGNRQYIKISAFQQWVEETNSPKAV